MFLSLIQVSPITERLPMYRYSTVLTMILDPKETPQLGT